MDASLPEEEENAIRECIAQHKDKVTGYHKLRTRKSGSQRYIDLHLVMPQNINVSAAHDFCDHLERDLPHVLL